MFKDGDKVRTLVDINKYAKKGDILLVKDGFDFYPNRDAGFSCAKGFVNTKWLNETNNSRFQLVKEEKEEMQFNMKGFDLKTNPWWIAVRNREEYELVQKWLLENYGAKCIAEHSREFKYLTNTTSGGHVEKSWVMHGSGDRPEHQEIKLTFKTVIDSVTFPEVKTEQQKQIEELEKTILLAKQQIEELKKI